MTYSKYRLSSVACSFAASLSVAVPAFADPVQFFETEVRPILAEHCYGCHGPEKQKSDLRLDSAAAMLQGASRGPVVKAGDPASLLLTVLGYTGEVKMPPDGKLPDEKIAVLQKWVADGAVWPDYGDAAKAAAKPAGIDLEAGRKHWAYQPISKPPTPAVAHAAWAKTDLDVFILNHIEGAGLQPAAQADKRTLIRRATFDLTGLPPKPDEVSAFLADESPEAYDKLIERLLASPQYGERWGRHWLDVVRYTDSFDSRATPATDPVEVWRYRDWVVNSVNADMPYDQFLRYQIAGDLIPAPDGGYNRDGLVATGMLAIGNWPQGDADKEKMVSDIVDDQIDVVSRGLLGSTLACARCHDHKFDPFTTQDYYALAGIFYSTSILPGPGAKTEGSPILHLPLASKEEIAQRAADQQQAEALRAERATLVREAQVQWVKQESARAADYLLAASASPGVDPATLNPQVVERWARFINQTGFALMNRVTPGIHGKAGLLGRVGTEDMPAAAANTSDEEMKYLSITQPAKSLIVHPAPVIPVEVAWRSPEAISGSVTARVADADASCGDGVAWKLINRRSGQDTILREGMVANGGAEDVTLDAPLDFNAGDFVILRVEPAMGHACDSTVLDLTIAPANGPAWNLSSEVVPQFELGNPWPDAAGRPEVWWLAESRAGLAPDSILFAPWTTAKAEVAAGARPAESLRDAARLVQASALQPADGAMAEYLAKFLGEAGPFWIEAPPLEQNPRLAEIDLALAPLDTRLAKSIELAVGIQEGGVPNTPYSGIRDVKVHKRGSYANLGDLVPRRMPVVLAGEVQPTVGAGSGRLELADWVASKSNPLAARVMVNRVWMLHFGQGLVRTPGDFGKQGMPPTHPELLDYLASEFIESGWSLKHLHRLMMGSATYQQASGGNGLSASKDPENQFFARMNRRKIEAEAVRDSILAASGRLDLAMGGMAVTDIAAPRRTLYLRTVRSNLNTFTTLFDGADPTSVVPRRNETLVSPQALFMLNNPFVVAEAEALAAKYAGEADIRAVVGALYEALFARPVTEQELGEGLALLKELGYPGDGALAAYIQVLYSSNEFMFVD